MEILDDNFKELFRLLNVKEKEFDFFDIVPPKEVIVSKWVDFLLNPSVNGVGNLPVSKLLDLVNKDISLDDYEFESTETEVSTDSFRRIDILVKYNGLWIVIENKIDSYENNGQTNDYYKYIESIKGKNEVVYIYLKPNYNSSSPLCDAFKIVTYDMFINKLKEISEFDYKDKEKYKYLKEFIISGGRFMNKEELEITESLKFYIKNIDKFEAIANEYKEKNRSIFNMITNSVADALNADGERWIQYNRGIYKFIQFYKENWKNTNKNGVHFEIYFDEVNIVGRIVSARILLHIEGNIKEEDRARFERENITVKSTTACYNGEPIEVKMDFDFTTYENIQKSIDIMIRVIKDFASKYEELIDRVLA